MRSEARRPWIMTLLQLKIHKKYGLELINDAQNEQMTVIDVISREPELFLAVIMIN